MTRKYIMREQERALAATALKACLPHLWDGLHLNEARMIPTDRSLYICFALRRATERRKCTVQSANIARRLVERSLYRACSGRAGRTYEEYLETIGMSWWRRHDAAFVQAQRKRWVLFLIKSLEDSLK